MTVLLWPFTIIKSEVLTYESITLEGDPIIYGDYTYKQYKLTDSKNENRYIIYQIENSNPENVKEIYQSDIKPFKDKVERFGLTYFDPEVFDTIDEDYNCFTISNGELKINPVRRLHHIDKGTFEIHILQFGENTIKIYKRTIEDNSITGIYTDVKYRLCEFIDTSSRECVLVNLLHNSGTTLSDGKIATIYIDLTSAVIYKLTNPHVNGSVATFKFSEHSVNHTIFYKNPVSDDEIITTVSGYSVLYTCAGGFFVTTNNLTSSYTWTGPTIQFTSTDWNYTRNTSPTTVEHSWVNTSCPFGLFGAGSQKHIISCNHNRQTVYNSSGSKIWGYERHSSWYEYDNGINLRCSHDKDDYSGSCSNKCSSYSYYASSTNGNSTKSEKDITITKDDYPFDREVIELDKIYTPIID